MAMAVLGTTGESSGLPPAPGAAKMVCELLVEDLDVSLSFWRGVLGFEIAYRREEDGFAYLQHPEGPQIMLGRRIEGRNETGELQYPFGRGVMFQLSLASIDPVLEALARRNWPLYRAPQEVWRRVGDREAGRREVRVRDPDGYYILIAERIGWRPLAGTAKNEG
jgi:catechol 2,3-dioxygenase-like lactoylglutathione lyase family enzyme